MEEIEEGWERKDRVEEKGEKRDINTLPQLHSSFKSRCMGPADIQCQGPRAVAKDGLAFLEGDPSDFHRDDVPLNKHC